MFLVLAMAACGTSSDDDAQAVFTQVIHDSCTKAFTCTSSEPAQDVDVYGSTEAQCEINFKALLGDVDASVTAGRVTFDSANSATCVTSVQAALTADSCTAFWADSTMLQTTTCDTIFVGHVATDGMCFSAVDCVEGDNCDLSDTNGTLNYPGTCQPPSS